MEGDPWAVLGLPVGATPAEARSARRRQARLEHPDVHRGSAPAEQAARTARMAALNRAVADIEAAWAGAARPEGATAGRPRPAPPERSERFSLDALPVDAFEALRLVAGGLGDIVAEDEPYTIEGYLDTPSTFYRLLLAPEAGGTEVTIDLLAPDSGILPAVEVVRDLLIAEIAALGGPGPAG